MLIRAGTVDLAPRRSTTVAPPVSFPPVSLPAATAPVPQRGTASVKSSPSQKFPSSSPAALVPDAARSRTASTAAKSVLPTKFAFKVDDPLWAGTSRCRLNFGRLTRNIMVGTTSFECDRFVKYVHRHRASVGNFGSCRDLKTSSWCSCQVPWNSWPAVLFFSCSSP